MLKPCYLTIFLILCFYKKQEIYMKYYQKTQQNCNIAVKFKTMQATISPNFLNIVFLLEKLIRLLRRKFETMCE